MEEGEMKRVKSGLAERFDKLYGQPAQMYGSSFKSAWFPDKAAGRQPHANMRNRFG